MEDKPEGTVLVLLDIYSKTVYTLQNFPVNIVSCRSMPSPATGHVMLIPPGKLGEEYSVLVEGGAPPVLRVLHGDCCIDGVAHTPSSQTSTLSPGCFITLGTSRSLQYESGDGAGNITPQRRKLPPTPGKSIQPSPPTKPRRQRQPQSLHQQTPPPQDTLPEDPGLRPRLQRIAAEVSARLGGYEERKPPPPYEQVGNSVGYQLLHQPRHKEITAKLIDSLYPPLKENVTKDAGLEASYSTYLKAYEQALGMPANPDCLLPADHPTIDFIVDLLLHLCCMPHMTGLVEKQGHVWLQVLAVLSRSWQNRTHLVARRYSSKILSCMHLSMMAGQVRFQEHGWTVLTNTLSLPPPPGNKPVLSEASLTLALCLAETQLDSHSKDLPLMITNVRFLAEVATLAKSSTSFSSSSGETAIYTPHQALQILALFQDRSILRHVMKVPSELRAEAEFEHCYSALVKGLVPIRGAAHMRKSRTPSSSSTSSSTSTASLPRRRRKQTSPSSRRMVPGERNSSVGNKPALLGNPGASHDLEHANSTDDLLKSCSSPQLGSCSDLSSPAQEERMRPMRSSSCSDLLDDDISQPTKYGLIDTPTSMVAKANSSVANGNQLPVTPVDIAVLAEEAERCGGRGGTSNRGSDEEWHGLSQATAKAPVEGSEVPVEGSPVEVSPVEGSEVPADGSSVCSTQHALPITTTTVGEASGVEESTVKVIPTSTQPDSTQLDSTQLDSTHPDSTQLDSLPVDSSDTSHVAVTSEDSVVSSQDGAHVSSPQASESSPKVGVASQVGGASPPLSPYTMEMSEDVQQLLELLHAPLQPTAGGIVRVPSLSLHNRYYRHSLKHKSTRRPHHHSNQQHMELQKEQGERQLEQEEQQKQLEQKDQLHEQQGEQQQQKEQQWQKHEQQGEEREQLKEKQEQQIQQQEQHVEGEKSGFEHNKQHVEQHGDRRVEQHGDRHVEQHGDRHVEQHGDQHVDQHKEDHLEKQHVWQNHTEEYGSDDDIDKSEVCGSPLTPSRMQWRAGVCERSLQGHDGSAMFEVSGHHLSFRYSVVEDVIAAHDDVHTTLASRHQLLQCVLSLWSRGKGLQAATNLLQACFSEEENDITFFMDTLPCFMAHKSPWTLAVCVVLLPPLHQLLSVQCLQRHVKMLCEVVLMIVERFSDLILAWQGSRFARKRISAAADREQQIICYKELHALRNTIHHHLDNSNHLPTETADHLRKLHAALRPFKKNN